jgi:hypothetical protein
MDIGVKYFSSIMVDMKGGQSRLAQKYLHCEVGHTLLLTSYSAADASIGTSTRMYVRTCRGLAVSGASGGDAAAADGPHHPAGHLCAVPPPRRGFGWVSGSSETFSLHIDTFCCWPGCPHQELAPNKLHTVLQRRTRTGRSRMRTQRALCWAPSCGPSPCPTSWRCGAAPLPSMCSCEHSPGHNRRPACLPSVSSSATGRSLPKLCTGWRTAGCVAAAGCLPVDGRVARRV